jgi:hypothetical protein
VSVDPLDGAAHRYLASRFGLRATYASADRSSTAQRMMPRAVDINAE